MTEEPQSPHARRTYRMPHTLVIVGALVVIVLALSWVDPVRQL